VAAAEEAAVDEGGRRGVVEGRKVAAVAVEEARTVRHIVVVGVEECPLGSLCEHLECILISMRFL